MEIETLNAMNQGMYLGLRMMLEVIVLFAIASLAIYLVGIAWLCFEETRQPARRQVKPMPEPPEPDEYDLLAVLAGLDDGLDDGLTGVARREPASMRHA